MPFLKSWVLKLRIGGIRNVCLNFLKKGKPKSPRNWAFQPSLIPVGMFLENPNGNPIQ